MASHKKVLILAQAKTDTGLATLQHSCSAQDGSTLTLHIHTGFHADHDRGKNGGELSTRNEVFLSSSTHITAVGASLTKVDMATTNISMAEKCNSHVSRKRVELDTGEQ